MMYLYMRHTATLILLANSLILYGSAGTLDMSYGPNNTGIVTTTVGRTNNLVCIAAQADNSIVGVGSVMVTMETSGICSFTTTGMLDTSFNGIGYKQISIGSKTVFVSIAVQPDTKVVAGGYTMQNGITKFAIARCDMTGTLDASFGGTGYVTTDIDGGSSINAIILQSDGKIIAGGVAGHGTPSFALARYNSDGSLDTTFGNQGTVRVNPGYVSEINALTLQSDGKILAAGFAWNFNTDICALVRFNSDGSLDTTFGTDGMVTLQIGVSSQATTLAIQQDGNIVIGGYTTDDYIHYAFALARYDATGILDPSFNGTGNIVTSINYSSKINTLAIQDDGKIVAAGYDFGLLSTDFTLARYLPTGALDTSFGTNGITHTSIGTDATIQSLIIQSDGKIVAAGMSGTSAALARYFA